MSETAVVMQGVVKRYPGVTAVDEVSLECARGEVHAIAGENGAGKSTLMRILYGLARPDAGTLTLHGLPYAPQGPRDALARGIGMVHQHFMLVPPMTVVENAMLGAEPVRFGFALNRAATRDRVAATAKRFGLDLDPDARVEDLSVGGRQRLEILKVLMRGANVLILDEPTAVLVPSEARSLLGTVRKLSDEGATVFFITHRLREVLEHADTITVMRHGRKIDSRRTADTTERGLVRMMVGREPAVRDEHARSPAGDAVLRLRDVGEERSRRAPRLRCATLEVCEGEIVGVCGVEGNGQRELTEIVAGLRAFQGHVSIDGTSIEGLGPADVRRLGVAHVPEDRMTAGVIGAMTLTENFLLGKEGEARFRRGISFDLARLSAHARERIDAFDVRPDDPEVPAATLSGGNQQKVIISREVERDPRVLLAVHPSRGVDVGAQEAIHDVLLSLRDRGCAVLLVTADLPEALQLSDRILVLYAGEIAAEFARGAADEESLGRVMVAGAAEGVAR